MTAIEFMQHLEEAFDKDLAPRVIKIYLDKLQRFNHDQLETLADKVLESSKVFPKIGHIFEVAREAGMLRTPIRETTAEGWSETDCPDCKGEGFLLVIMEVDQDRELHPIFVGQYSGSGRQNVKPRPRTYEYMYRCPCPAGDEKSKQIGQWEHRSWQPVDSDFTRTDPSSEQIRSVKEFVEEALPEDRWII